MSARLNFKEPKPISWKGRTFTQISSAITKNGKINTTTNNATFHRLAFNPIPLKIYRREIAASDKKLCNERTSTSIDELNMPGSTIIYPDPTSTNDYRGIKTTLDINFMNNKTEHPGICSDTNACMEKNARARVRSSGMIKRKFNAAKNNDCYYTSTNQYLASRNRTFQQNQYNFIQKGDSTLKPGDTLSVSNIYSPGGISHCKKYYIASDVSFSYTWLDSLSYDVTVPRGYYDVTDLDSLFKDTMLNNNHYFVDSFNNANNFLLNITYNNTYNSIELQTIKYDNSIFGPSLRYTSPLGVVTTTWLAGALPKFVINSNTVFQAAIGYTAGTYPATNLVRNYAQSSFTPGIKPNYVSLYYKPNNSQFAQQGGVSSSSLIARKRYNTITDNTSIFYKAYGKSVANALAYGVPENGYTLKDKIGYPLTKTPIFSKVTGALINCSSSDCTVKHL